LEKSSNDVIAHIDREKQQVTLMSEWLTVAATTDDRYKQVESTQHR